MIGIKDRAAVPDDGASYWLQQTIHGETRGERQSPRHGGRGPAPPRTGDLPGRRPEALSRAIELSGVNSERNHRVAARWHTRVQQNLISCCAGFGDRAFLTRFAGCEATY